MNPPKYLPKTCVYFKNMDKDIILTTVVSIRYRIKHKDYIYNLDGCIADFMEFQLGLTKELFKKIN